MVPFVEDVGECAPRGDWLGRVVTMLEGRRLATVALLAGLMALSGCGALPSVLFGGIEQTPTATPVVVIVAAQGRIAPSTATPGDREPPTPTFSDSFKGIVTTTVPLDLTPRRLTPTPTQTPPDMRDTRTSVSTRTPIPTSTPIPTRQSESPQAVATNTHVPSRTPTPEPTVAPTRTPRDTPTPTPTKTASPTRVPSRTPTETATRAPTFTPIPFQPHDSEGGQGGNDNRGQATDLTGARDAVDGLEGKLQSPEDVDVYRIEVPLEENGNILLITFEVVPLGVDADDLYRLIVETPSRGILGFGRKIGVATREARVPINDDTGTYYVEISRRSGRSLPQGEYRLTWRIREPGGG